MTYLTKLGYVLIKNRMLCILLTLAFCLRVAGIGYGLPLIVVSDESAFPLAALVMLQTHTLIPALDPEAFRSFLYYPPYLAYILLLPYIGIVAIKFLLWEGSPALFPAHLLSDLWIFFLTARFITVLLGTASVYLLYRISERLFRSPIAAAGAAFLLATSLLHMALSMVDRQWLAASLVYIMLLYVLTNDTLRWNHRYFFAFIVVGIGMGISNVSFLGLALIGWWHLFCGMVPFERLIKDRLIVLGVVLCLALMVLPTLLHHSGNGFLNDVTLRKSKSLSGLLLSPYTALAFNLFSEPILVLFFVGGLALLWTSNRKLSLFVVAWFLTYVLVFYISFVILARYLLPLIPLYALLGGYTISRLATTRAGAAVVVLLLLIPLLCAARLSMLAYRGDTRELARQWLLTHLTPSDRVLVYAEGTRLPTNAEEVARLRSIDPSAVRKTDEADAAINRKDVPSALNVYNVANVDFFHGVADYAKFHGYEYLLLQPDYAYATDFAALISPATVVATFPGLGKADSLAYSVFTAPFTSLFSGTPLGPDVVVYKLH